MAVAPHALAAQSALDVLREDGNALEAMIAAAATIAVAYPHMNSIGGDSFWLFHTPYSGARGIDACGDAEHAYMRSLAEAQAARLFQHRREPERVVEHAGRAIAIAERQGHTD